MEKEISYDEFLRQKEKRKKSREVQGEKDKFKMSVVKKEKRPVKINDRNFESYIEDDFEELEQI
ncbi:MAG: hypothetical protein JW708_12530 [Vallitaleaceae bacterium]|nr:hypothetical protein [Vallitaleaceae bacterium]